VPVTTIQYAFDESHNLKGPLVAAALLLMVLDTLAVFWMGGLFSRRPRRAGTVAATTAALLIALGALVGHTDITRADDSKPGDERAIEDISKTRIAYVQT
ncbi:MAG: RNA-binding protein, partial [Mesorhizobium sp.]